MLHVTDKATALLREMQSGHEEAAEKTLRLVQRGKDFDLTFDIPNDDDHVFKSEDQDVLLVAPDVADLLSDAIIDAAETPEGRRLTLSKQGG